MTDSTLPSSARIYIDSHCHFDFAPFAEDREAVWQACQQQGLVAMVVPGIAPEQWSDAVALRQRFSGVYPAAGVHPWWVESVFGAKPSATKLDAVFAALAEHLRKENCVAIGECGLDALIDTPLDDQEAVLERHLALAAEQAKPLIIHCRKAHNELLRALKRHSLPAGGVIHAFSGSAEMARQYWSMGFYLGIGGTITYQRAHKTRAAVQQLPLESLLLETDAPDMPLCGHQGTRNSPACITVIAQTLADLRGETPDLIAQQTTANARRLFSL